MDYPVYLFYLVTAGRNSATYAVHTMYESKISEKREWRLPKPVSMEKGKKVIEGRLQRGHFLISSWQSFYEWLGHGKGWAYFGTEAAEFYVPHWLTRYDAA